MAAKYWIKLYHEILYDPKMGMMSDRLYRRTIELFLLAGEMDQDGYLPAIEQIAWKLRCDPEQLETEMIELQRVGILSVSEGEWYVTKFAERQAPVSDAERMRRYRERKQKQEYYERVTKRNADTEEDTDTEADDIPPLPTSAKEAQAHPLIRPYIDVCGKIPGRRDYKIVADTVEMLIARWNSNFEENAKKYWLAWKQRGYSDTNPAWLAEWAVNEYIPPQSKSEPAAPDPRKGFSRA